MAPGGGALRGWGEWEDLDDLGNATVESGRDGSGSVCV